MLSGCPICKRPLTPVFTDHTVYAFTGDGNTPGEGFQIYSCGLKGHIIITHNGNGSSPPAKAQTANGAGHPSILNSWKEIAAYLGRGVRTVQRFEAMLGLPVHRPKGKDRSSVLAFTEEVDTWLHQTPVSNQGRTAPGRVLPDGSEARAA